MGNGRRGHPAKINRRPSRSQIPALGSGQNSLGSSMGARHHAVTGDSEGREHRALLWPQEPPGISFLRAIQNLVPSLPRLGFLHM